jgi:hypothetical protein
MKIRVSIKVRDIKVLARVATLEWRKQKERRASKKEAKKGATGFDPV